MRVLVSDEQIYIYIYICTYFSPEDQENSFSKGQMTMSSVMGVNLLALLSPCKIAAISAPFLEGPISSHRRDFQCEIRSLTRITD